MPITINGVTDARTGLVASTLSGFSADIDGTYTAPPGVVGSMNPTLDGFTPSLDGQYSPSASFNGSVSTTLGGFIPNLTDPGGRVGIIKELSFSSNSFNSHGSAVDGIALQTWDTSDTSYVSRAAGGTWDSNWHTTRININVEHGLTGPENNDALRMRIARDIPYLDEQNAPRDKVFDSLNGWTSGFHCDTEYWLGFAVLIPSTYVSDGEFGRETLLQLHADSTPAGVISLVIDQGTMKLLSRTTDTSTTGGTEREHYRQSVSTNLGKITYFTLHFRLNPFTTTTTVTAGMGSQAQVGRTFDPDGFMDVWVSLDPGATCTSDDMGSVTNTGGSRDDFLVSSVGAIGRVPDWWDGITDLGSLYAEWGVYKSRWYGNPPQWPPLAIPHVDSTKFGPIEIDLAWVKWGDLDSTFSSVHPARLPEPV